LDYVENKTDENLPLLVIPAEAGIYSLDLTLDSRFRRDFKMANNFTFKATVVKCAREVSGIFDIMDPLFESL
jgi:hypothetical protein